MIIEFLLVSHSYIRSSNSRPSAREQWSNWHNYKREHKDEGVRMKRFINSCPYMTWRRCRLFCTKYCTYLKRFNTVLMMIMKSSSIVSIAVFLTGVHSNYYGASYHPVYRIGEPMYNEFVVEFVLAQDNTKSYVKFLTELKRDLMPKFVMTIQERYPGSKFGLTVFSD